MKKNCLLILIHYLLIFSFLYFSCAEKINTSFPNNNLVETKTIKRLGTCLFDNIVCGLKDKEGNLWFGSTQNGVYRFDGKSFSHFTEKDGLCSNEISCIYEDKKAQLWFGTADGISRYDAFTSLSSGLKSFTSLRIPEPADRNFQVYKINSNDKPYTINMIKSVFQDKTGFYWFASNVGVFRYDGKSFSYFLHNDNIINNSKLHLKHVSSILQDKNGIIWFASYNQEGICRFDGKSISNIKLYGDGMILSLLEDKKGNIWIGSKNHGTFCFDGKSFTNFTKNDGLCNNTVTTIIDDRNGNIWFGSDGKDGGASRFDGKSFTCLTKVDGLGNNSIWTILEDNSGNLWFGTRGMGLYKFDGKTIINFSSSL